MDYGCKSDFFENNDHARRDTMIVLRDSLGMLAVAKLQATYDLSTLPTSEMLDRLHDIINELDEQYEYHRTHYST